MVEDNFFPEIFFKDLEYFVLNSGNCPFFLQRIVNGQQTDSTHYYWTHLVMANGKRISELFDNLIDQLTEQLNPHAFVRIKINLYPSTHKIVEHAPHTDYSFPHKGIILGLNTCDGYTKLADGTKVESSVRNRAFFFDPSLSHSSSTCTNQQFRANININYV